MTQKYQGLQVLLKNSELYHSSQNFLDKISNKILSGAVALETMLMPSDIYAGSNEPIIPISVHPFVYTLAGITSFTLSYCLPRRRMYARAFSRAGGIGLVALGFFEELKKAGVIN